MFFSGVALQVAVVCGVRCSVRYACVVASVEDDNGTVQVCTVHREL